MGGIMSTRLAASFENGDKQRPTKRKQVQGMLDTTDSSSKIFGGDNIGGDAPVLWNGRH